MRKNKSKNKKIKYAVRTWLVKPDMPVMWTGESYEEIFQMLRGRGIEFDPEKLEKGFWAEEGGNNGGYSHPERK